MRSLLDTVILVVDFPPFSTLNISCHSLLAWRVSAERSAVERMGFPLYVTCCFSLAALNILSLGLVFVSLISMCLGMFLLGFILYGTLCASWTWFDYFLFHVGEIFNYNLFKNFLIPFLFLFFWDPYNSNVGEFDIIWEVSETILSPFQLFTLFCSSGVISTILSSSSLIRSSSDILLLIPSRVFLISVTVLFVSVCLTLTFRVN